MIESYPLYEVLVIKETRFMARLETASPANLIPPRLSPRITYTSPAFASRRLFASRRRPPGRRRRRRRPWPWLPLAFKEPLYRLGDRICDPAYSDTYPAEEATATSHPPELLTPC
jgi:hypothetical protein